MWRTVAGLLCLWAAWPARSHPVPVDIAAGPARETLHAFLLLTQYEDFNILYDNQLCIGTRCLKDIRTRAVHGMLEPQVALDRMLEGTGLRLLMVSERSWTISTEPAVVLPPKSSFRKVLPYRKAHTREPSACPCIVIGDYVTPWCDDGSPKLQVCDEARMR